eukprot:4767845-Lingulodinium_polyedra.AAC.1
MRSNLRCVASTRRNAARMDAPRAPGNGAHMLRAWCAACVLLARCFRAGFVLLPYCLGAAW